MGRGNGRVRRGAKIPCDKRYGQASASVEMTLGWVGRWVGCGKGRVRRVAKIPCDKRYGQASTSVEMTLWWRLGALRSG